MTYVITDKCIGCKYTDCVDVCPVDAFHIGQHTLIINPISCIDCALCEPVCPIDAIIPDTVEHPLMEQFLSFAEDSLIDWPIITKHQEAHVNANHNATIRNKWAKRQ